VLCRREGKASEEGKKQARGRRGDPHLDSRGKVLGGVPVDRVREATLRRGSKGGEQKEMFSSKNDASV